MTRKSKLRLVRDHHSQAPASMPAIGSNAQVRYFAALTELMTHARVLPVVIPKLVADGTTVNVMVCREALRRLGASLDAVQARIDEGGLITNFAQAGAAAAAAAQAVAAQADGPPTAA